MTQHMCYGLFVWLSICSLVNSYGPKVGIFTQCGDGTGYNKLVPDYDKTRVIIDGSSFYPPGSLVCTAVFRAQDNDDRLYYQINSYSMSSQDTKIKIETKSEGSSYREMESFPRFFSQSINREKSAKTYIRITVTREDVNTDHFYVALDLYTDEYWSDLHSIVKLTIGAIIGIVAAIIAVIVILVLVCLCCLCKGKRNRPGKGVVVTTDTRNAHIDIPDIGTTRTYPYAPPAENFASHPGYPVAYPPQSYGQQPPPYGQQPLPAYGQQPPPYTDNVPVKPSAPIY